MMLVESGRSITACSIKKHVLGLDETKRMILEIFKDHNCRMKLLGRK